mgnify:CR=1 FL=1
MAEVSFFPKYEQKENKVTNYTLLILKQLYNESPKLFQEFMTNLIKNDKNNIDVGVNFWQQKGFECINGKSILDGVITQSAFTIFIETKLSDWFYSEQLKRHFSNLIELEGKKIFLALSNFDGQRSTVFEEFMNKYKNEKDVIFAYFEFGNFIDILKSLKSNIKSEQLLLLLDEFEEFLYNENLLPLWKYRLDVVNCAVSKNDVIERNDIKNDAELVSLVEIISSSIGSLSNPKKLSDTFKSTAGLNIDPKTISSYLKYLEEAFLIEKAERYDVKGKKYMSTPYKFYFSDLGIRNSFINFRQYEETHIMENIIYLELKRRGYNVDVGVVELKERKEKEFTYKQLEVDFIANKGNNKIYIQSAFSMPDDEKKMQETRPLLKINDSFKKIIVVKDYIKRTRDENGIITMSIFDFLLDINSLDY